MATSVTDEQAERIDAFLGDGTYDTWHVLDMEADMQLSRKKRADTALRRVDSRLAVLSPYGTDWVQKLQNDCASAIELIKQNKFPDPAQFSPLHSGRGAASPGAARARPTTARGAGRGNRSRDQGPARRRDLDRRAIHPGARPAGEG